MEINTKINSLIFKAYDVRGVYPQEINEKTAYLIGRAFVKFLKKTNPNIVVGQDNRFSSSILFKHLSKGIIDQGGNVIDIKLATTPMLYFANAYFKYHGGIEITASHNPVKYNGFKIVKENSFPVSSENGLLEIKKIIQENSFSEKPVKGKIQKKQIKKEYLEFNLKEFNLNNLKKFKIIVDPAKAVTEILILDVFKKTNIDYICLSVKHGLDPLKKENLRFLIDKIKKEKADLGVAFDGDGDRIIFVDEKGVPVSGDLITALIAESILIKNPRQKILYDIRSSNVVKEIIQKLNGIPVPSRTGHSLIKEQMRKENIIFGGELSGHYYHKDHFFSEAPFFVLFNILEILSKNNKTLSQTIKLFQKYFHSKEINFKVKDSDKVLKKIKEKYKKQKISKIDGLRVDFKDSWFLVRKSNTEPVIRLIVEAKTKKQMQLRIKSLTSLITK